MEITKRIYTAITALCTALMMFSCSNETDTTLASQQKAIETYLTGSHTPRLIEEYLIPEAVIDNPPFYTQWNLNIFRYISTYYDKGREKWPVIERGTTFDIMYTAYIFRNGKPSAADMYATNIEANIKELYKGYDDETNIWSTEPVRITLGRDSLVGGLSTALEGCRIGDSVEVYLTYDAAYGKHYFGVIPSRTAVMWEIKIIEAK
ncbi:MAG: FKBP-type peptidyl-prolyl cis-trans isomerase [Alistipes sp.]|nr:FKBP-type peptidyl-prolyl cis-trans isomerase [Alistipes sp.]